MGFYDEPDKVQMYIDMCADYDGTPLYEVLRRHLGQGKSMLELGCGPGFDIAALRNDYQITGSDLSVEFLSLCQQKFPDLPFELLDAVGLETSEKFDCVYSNKVLQHLLMSELELSLQRQQQILNDGGLVAHSFWLGGKEETMNGLYFLYHEQDVLLQLIGKYFKVLEVYLYGEFEDGDSLFVVAQKH